MRWNPSTKMVQVCDGGIWYDKEYFDPHWDGYIFKEGVYNPEYFNPTWLTNANGYGGFSAQMNSTQTAFVMSLSVSGGSVAKSDILMPVKLPTNMAYTLKVDLTVNSSVPGYKKSGDSSDYPKVCVKTSTAVNANSGTANSISTQNVAYSQLNSRMTKSFDLSNYVGRELYLSICDICQYTSDTVTIHNIWVEPQ